MSFEFDPNIDKTGHLDKKFQISYTIILILELVD